MSLSGVELISGEFTVKSAYHLLYQQSCGGEKSSSGDATKRIWTGIWSAKVAPKIQNFVWRACRNILPTQTKLFYRKISSSFSCHWCEEEPETGDHVLWQCEFAQRVWTACSVQLPWSVDMRMAFGDFLDVCLRDMRSPDVELILLQLGFFGVPEIN